MASSSPNKVVAARAAAILTTAEVAAATLDLNETYAGRVSVDINFTLGSLTNVVLRYYVSMDGTNWTPVETDGGDGVSHTLTATTTKAVPVQAGGWKFFKTSAQGTGTVTSSSLTLNYRYLRRGSQ